MATHAPATLTTAPATRTTHSVVWILLAGVSSNMAWYYVKRGRAERAARARSVTG